MTDPASRGYVTEEYFFEGEAVRFEPTPGSELGDDGRWSLRVAGSAPFRSRLVVVRPSDPERFTGTVVVNWLNVSAGIELGSADGDEHLSGCAWVGVSAQKVGIDGFGGSSEYAAEAERLPVGPLKRWEPERYGSLVHPGDEYSFDIFTQAVRVVSGRGGPVDGPDPLAGLQVERVLATGASQSAIRLQSYLNGVQPLEGLVDGFLLTVPFGAGTTFEPSSPELPMGSVIPTRVRDDSQVPVMLLNSETETTSIQPVRQHDTDRFVHWEVAGAPHAYMPGFPPAPVGEGRVPNTLSYAPISEAALRHMLRWLRGGQAPPSQPRIEFAGQPAQIARDRFGNALGGIRLPEMAAPIAEYCGLGDGPGPFGWLFGWARLFSEEELASLYPSRQAYEDAYVRAVEECVAAGVVREQDGPSLKSQAAGVAATLPLPEHAH
jgi:hypothetical protein